jgi:exonuclease III
MALNFLFVVAIIAIFCVCKIFSTDTECPTAPTTSEDRRLNKNKLRLVEYNVEWLFIDPFNGCPGSSCSWANSTEADIHMSYVANVVNSLDADIINFCEVEGCDELNILNSYLDGTYQPYLKKGTDSSTGQNVGMLTRVDPLVSLYRTENRYNYPIPNSQCGYTGSSSSAVSKHYITELSIADMKVAMIGAHLIAYPTDASRCAQREAQASVLQAVIADYVTKGYEIIMIGDFNDYDREILDVNNHKPTSQALDIMKGLKGDYAGKYILTNVASNIIQSERYSEWYDSDSNCDTFSPEDYSMIDHILVSEKIAQKITNVSIYHGYDEFCGTYNSDHYPVIVDLAW